MCPLYPLPATDSDECVVAVLSCWWRCWRLPAPVSSDSSLVQPSHWSIVRYPPLFCNYSPSFTAGIVRGSPDPDLAQVSWLHRGQCRSRSRVGAGGWRLQCSGSVARPARSGLHWSRRAAANHAVTMLAYYATIAYFHLNTGYQHHHSKALL